MAAGSLPQDPSDALAQRQALVKLFVAKVVSKLPSSTFAKFARYVATKVPGKTIKSKVTAAEKSCVAGFFTRLKECKNYDVDILACELLDISVG